MRILFHTVTVSPHQLPLAKRLVEACADEGDCSLTYIPDREISVERQRLGWLDTDLPWILSGCDTRTAFSHCKSADFLFSSNRTFDIFSDRAKDCQPTVYCSERWLKPMIGIARLLIPSYWRMARRMVSLLSNDSKFYYFPMGIHAARDMARICGLMHGDLRCLFRAPELEFENKPGGRIFSRVERVDRVEWEKRYCLDKMRMWGYFVEPGNSERRLKIGCRSSDDHIPLRVLWVGRLLKWKCVDTIIRAVGEIASLRKADNAIPRTTLDIYGVGPDAARLKKMAAKCGDLIRFHDPVPISEVRELMHTHDEYVLASNGYEGWGAVVSEALEERMRVIASSDSGAGATLLPIERQFKSGDVKALSALLTKECKGDLPLVSIGDWTAQGAARFLLDFAEGLCNGNSW